MALLMLYVMPLVIACACWGAGGHPQYEPSSFMPASGSDDGCAPCSTRVQCVFDDLGLARYLGVKSQDVLA